MKKTNQKKEIWETKEYFNSAKKGSLDKKHPGMKILFDLTKNAKNILDMGCGEGTRLGLVTAKGVLGQGIDISKTAILMAKKRYPKLKFILGNLSKLPYKNDYFDLVYSAFVLEHLANPEKMINEAVRVVKSGGYLVLVAPNYGAPNRASPVFMGSRIKKLIFGFLRDLLFQNNKLNWNKVKPVTNFSEYKMDMDTQVEPYIRTLIKYLINKNLKIIEWNSCWNQELPNVKFHQIIFRLLRNFNPFCYWGPHLVVVVQK